MYTACARSIKQRVCSSTHLFQRILRFDERVVSTSVPNGEAEDTDIRERVGRSSLYVQGNKFSKFKRPMFISVVCGEILANLENRTRPNAEENRQWPVCCQDVESIAGELLEFSMTDVRMLVCRCCARRSTYKIARTCTPRMASNP